MCVSVGGRCVLRASGRALITLFTLLIIKKVNNVLYDFFFDFMIIIFRDVVEGVRQPS